MQTETVSASHNRRLMPGAVRLYEGRAIVAIAGPLGSGKGTVAGRLRERWGFTEVGFADGLKRLCIDVAAPTGLTEAVAFGASEKRNAPLPYARSLIVWRGVMARARAHEGRFMALFNDRLNPESVRAEWRAAWGALAAEATMQRESLTARRVLQVIGTDCGRKLWPDVWVAALMRAIDGGEHGARVAISDARFADNEAPPVLARGGAAWWVSRPGFETTTGAHSSEPRFSDWASVATNVLTNSGELEALNHITDSAAAMMLHGSLH